MRSVMTHSFSQVPHADIPRSSFDRSHGYKTTFDAGYLVPFFLDEVLPGDTFNLSATLFARMATPIVPLMDNLRLETFFFFVPNRLLMDNWQKLCGEQKNPGDSTDYLTPTLGGTVNFAVGSIGDYFSLPTGVDLRGSDISAFPFRAYNLCWNEWFRDQNLQESLEVPLTDGPDDVELYNLVRRGKRHDYFTSCLPWPQKGPGVDIPLGGTIPVTGTLSVPTGQFIIPAPHVAYVNSSGVGQAIPLDISPNFPAQYATDPSSGNDITSLGWSLYASDPSKTNVPAADNSNLAYLRNGTVLSVPVSPGLVGNLAETTVVTINALREAFQMQRLYERDARGGTRYTEILRAHFGVTSPDARLQRPEYLGGSSTAININPVQQTSSTDATTPQGNLAAFGIAADRFHGFTKSFVEHGIIIGFVNVRADLTYQQGIPRMFSRKTRFDYYWPALAHLGEQAVLNKEIYAQGTDTDDEVFGYQERWAEYRYFPSKITGKFRSSDPQPLDIWHLSQEFSSLPLLNDSFIRDDPPLDRVIAVPSEPHFLLDTFINLKCARPMPVYSVPGMMDHF